MPLRARGCREACSALVSQVLDRVQRFFRHPRGCRSCWAIRNAPRCSCTTLPARSRTSGENLFDLLIAQSSQSVESLQARGDSLPQCGLTSVECGICEKILTYAKLCFQMSVYAIIYCVSGFGVFVVLFDIFESCLAFRAKLALSEIS